MSENPNPQTTTEPLPLVDAETVDPTRVWTSADVPSVDADPTNRSTLDPDEPPASGIRIGQLVWACIVIALGVLLILKAVNAAFDLPLILIGLIGVLGLTFIIASFFVSGTTTKTCGGAPMGRGPEDR